MMVELRSTIIRGLSLVVVGVALAASTASGAATVRIDVVRCPTVFGITGVHPKGPSTISVSASGPAHGLVAYSNTQIVLVGPRGLRCDGHRRGRRRHRGGGLGAGRGPAGRPLPRRRA